MTVTLSFHSYGTKKITAVERMNESTTFFNYQYPAP